MRVPPKQGGGTPGAHLGRRGRNETGARGSALTAQAWPPPRAWVSPGPWTRTLEARGWCVCAGVLGQSNALAKAWSTLLTAATLARQPLRGPSHYALVSSESRRLRLLRCVSSVFALLCPLDSSCAAPPCAFLPRLPAVGTCLASATTRRGVLLRSTCASAGCSPDSR